MKKLFGLLSTCFILIAIASCSNLNESSSLSLTFNGSDFARNSLARNISVSSEYEGYYIVASVLGDYRETKSLQISGSGTYTIEFDSVPVGSEIYVEANVYKPSEYDYLHAFTGKSQTQTVYAGENNVNLVMKNLQNFENNKIINCISAELPNGDSLENNPTLYLYENGKYKLSMENLIYSEGLWRCSVLDEDGLPDVYGEYSFTLYLTEYICFNVSSNASLGIPGDAQLTNYVIIERPTEKSFSKDEISNLFNFSFTSASGVTFWLGSI